MKTSKSKISDTFKNLSNKVLKHSEIAKLYHDNREYWELPKSTSSNEFIELLLDQTEMGELKLEFPSRNLIRYTWGEVSIYEVALSLAKSSYFTHSTAMYFNSLTDYAPNSIYVNVEQSLTRHAKTPYEVGNN